MPRGTMAGALLACAACGGGGAAVSLNTVIAGERMVAKDAVSNIVAADKAGTKKTALIYIADVPSTCAMLNAGQETRNSKGIMLQLATLTGSSVSAPATTGDYVVHPSSPAGNVAEAYYWQNDAACEEANDMTGVSGTVTLTAIDGNSYSGTIDITFEDRSHVTGSFTSTACAALVPLFNVGICI